MKHIFLRLTLAVIFFSCVATLADAQTIRTRAYLDTRFETGDFPTATDYKDWRASFWHVTEDTIPVTNLVGVDELSNDVALADSSSRALVTEAAVKAYVDAVGAGSSLTDGDKGDITVSGGATVWNIDTDAVGSAEIATGAVGTSEIANGSVANADLATMPANTIKGNNTAGAISPVDLTTAQVKTLLDIQTTDLSDFAEAVEDKIGTKVVAGGGITVAYDDGTGETTISGTGLSDGDKTDITVSGSGTTWTIDNDAVTLAKQASGTANRLQGFDGAGDPSEITVSGATLSAGALSVTATTVPNTPAGNIAATDVQAAINELDTEKLAASSYTAADVLAKLVTVDGTGSNVDADLFDGQNSSAFGLVASPLSQFAATTSAQLAGVLSDETGSGGGFVRATSPTLTTPNLGTPSAATLTNATGLPIVAGTTGTLSVARGGTGLTSLGSALQVLRVNAGGTALEYAAASGGISGLTTNYIPKATSSTAIGNSQIFDNGTNVGIGTASPAAKTEIINATTQLRLTETATVDFADFSVNGDGNLTISPSGKTVLMPYLRLGNNFTSSFFIFPFTTNSGVPNETGENLSFYNYSGSGSTTGGAIGFAGSPFTQTTGINYHTRYTNNFSPSSGTAEFNFMGFTGSINQTGGASGVSRGILLNHILTAASDYRAIEIANNSHWGVYQSGGSAKNYFSGNTGIANLSPSEKLDVTGNIRTSGQLQFGGSTNYINMSGGDLFTVTASGAGIGLNAEGSTTELYLKSGNATIGGLTGVNKLNVTGAAVIGAGYVSTVAPTNGLLVEGNVGIGTTSAEGILHAETTGAYQLLRSTNGTLSTRITLENTADDNDSWQVRRSASGEFVLGHSALQPYGTETKVIECTASEVRIIQDLVLDTAGNVRVMVGSGTPEAAVTAGVGSTFHRTDGGAGTSFYVKESGTGNTGWVAK